MHRKDELSKLARIRVDIPNALEHLWTLDIRKSSASPPDVIKTNLKRIVDRISEGSKATWTFRGKREVGSDGSHLWTKMRTRDRIIGRRCGICPTGGNFSAFVGYINKQIRE